MISDLPRPCAACFTEFGVSQAQAMQKEREILCPKIEDTGSVPTLSRLLFIKFSRGEQWNYFLKVNRAGNGTRYPSKTG